MVILAPIIIIQVFSQSALMVEPLQYACCSLQVEIKLSPIVLCGGTEKNHVGLSE